MKKCYYLIMISLLCITGYCIFQNNKLENEIKHLENSKTNLSNDVMKYKKTNEKLNKSITELSAKNNIFNEDSQIICNTAPIQELGIDGSHLYYFDEDEFYLKYKDKIFISTDFIQKYYNLYNYGSNCVIRGEPYEENIIKTSGVYSLYNINKLFEENETEKIERDYDTTEYKLDGLLIECFEAGKIYTISKPLYMTGRGITIGSTRNQVKKAYGTLGKDTDNTWRTFNKSGEGIYTSFSFKDNKVIEIKCSFQ